jgi:hypothetical protein
MTRQQGTAGRSPLLRRQSDDLRFDWIGCDMAELKAGARSQGGTLNDAFLAAVSVGLQAYHADHGVPTERLRAAVAVNTRTEDQGYQGNRVTAVVVELPLLDDPATAVVECGRVARSHTQDEDVLWLLDRFRALANRLPRRLTVPITRKTMAGFDLQLSNARGPDERNTFFGVTTLAQCPFPVGGPSAVTITMATFGGRADLGIVTDRAAIPDPELLVHHLEEGLKAVIALAVD